MFCFCFFVSTYCRHS
uniref:Uncharacterized protein n=1 Tax=Rhizophora mucronata TaxID=61149 RepID=A0A2P2NRZ2_RHIMU